MWLKIKLFFTLLFADYIVYRQHNIDKHIEYGYYVKEEKKLYFVRNVRRRSHFSSLAAMKSIKGFKEFNRSPVWTYHTMPVRELVMRGFNPNNPIDNSTPFNVLQFEN